MVHYGPGTCNASWICCEGKCDALWGRGKGEVDASLGPMLMNIV
jgi:hypothetical protein